MTIDKSKTDLIKGVGILLIALHNYFHWVPPSTGENEFIFNPDFIGNLASIISNSFLDSINALFSYFGHYGVQLFIFISGYGLAKSYMSKPQNFVLFFKKRAIKIYPAFLIGILVLIVYNAIIYSQLPSAEWSLQILYKLLMIHTLIPNEALSINGPWWFYGLIMQLYLLFIPLFFIIKKWDWKGFILTLIISYSIIFLLYSPLLEMKLYVMANAPGHIPEFALGIFLALNPKLNVKVWSLPILLTLFILGNFSYYFYPLTFVIVSYLLLIGILKTFQKDTIFSTIVKFYGEISMYLFAIHGFLRRPYFSGWAKEYNSTTITFALGILFLLFATVAAYFCMAGHRHSNSLLNKWLTARKIRQQH